MCTSSGKINEPIESKYTELIHRVWALLTQLLSKIVVEFIDIMTLPKISSSYNSNKFIDSSLIIWSYIIFMIEYQ